MENDYADPAAPVSRPAGPDTPEAVPAGAGNQAYVDAREQAEQLRKPLTDLREQLLRDYQAHAVPPRTGVDW